MIDPALEHVLRGALALLLATGAVAKLRDLARFRAVIEGYELVPARAAGVVATAFAALEASLAAGLLLPEAIRLRPTSLAAAAALFAVYGLAIAINLARGRRDIECGCGGRDAHVPLSGWLLGRNALLAAMALACLGGGAPRALTSVDVLTIAGGIAVLALIWTALHGLLAYDAALAREQEDV